jgi:prevent-host-death family protein
MYQIDAGDLKQHTGDVIARVQRGERVLLTHRGAAIAVISPIDHTAIEAMVDREAEKAETLGRLALTQSAFQFWENEEDAVWDQVAADRPDGASVLARQRIVTPEVDDA